MKDSKISNQVDTNLDSIMKEVVKSEAPYGTVKKKEWNNNTSTSTGKNRKPNSASTTKINKYAGRDEKVDPDLYYTVKQENEHLKTHQYKLNDEIKK